MATLAGPVQGQQVPAVEAGPARRWARSGAAPCAAVVVLPQPDSPTRPKVSPTPHLERRPRPPRGRCSGGGQPSRTWKCFFRSAHEEESGPFTPPVPVGGHDAPPSPRPPAPGSGSERRQRSRPRGSGYGNGQPSGRSRRVRHHAPSWTPAFPGDPGRGMPGQQAEGVGVHGAGEQVGHPALLDDPAGVHHRDPSAVRPPPPGRG